MSNPRRAKPSSAIAGLTIVEPPPAVMAKPEPRRSDVPVKVGVFVPPAVHRRLREISLNRNVSLSQIFMAGLDLYLAQLGEPPAAELAGEKR